MSDLVIAIDGGGTSCRAAIARSDGAVIGMAKSGPANILSDSGTALDSIITATRDAFEAAGIDPQRMKSTPALLGLAGSNVGDVAERLIARLPFGRSEIVNDGLIALEGALGKGDGAVAIVGTGTIYVSRLAGKLRYYGGWGFVVADQGSGAWLGRSLLQTCLLAHDGVRTGSALTSAVLSEFGDDPARLVAFAARATPRDFGHFAPRLFEAAGAGDAVALSVLKSGAAQIEETLDVVLASGVQRLCLLGGLGPHYPRWLSERVSRRLVPAKGDALSGAVSLAVEHFAREVTP